MATRRTQGVDVLLTPMGDEEADRLIDSAVESMLQDAVTAGAPEQIARRLVAERTAELLPDASRTAGHEFRHIDVGRETIGRLWFGPAPDGGAGHHLYEIDVAAEHRSRGFGRSALIAVLDELDRCGSRGLGLSVAVSNERAMALYESLGFETVETTELQREMWRAAR